jgi:hypothetical protein
MNFVQFSLKRMAEDPDAGIAPQCLQDTVGSSGCSQARCSVLRDLPGILHQQGRTVHEVNE